MRAAEGATAIVASWPPKGLEVINAFELPLLNITATRDRIAPASTAACGETIPIDSGHVGMIVGSARSRLHDALARFLRSV